MSAYRALRPAVLTILLVLANATFPNAATATDSVDLGIPGQLERQPSWRSATVSAMVLQALGAPPVNTDFACGVAGLFDRTRGRNACLETCVGCELPNNDAETLAALIGRYATHYFEQVAAPARTITVQPRAGALPPFTLRAVLGKPAVPIALGAQQTMAVIAGHRTIDRVLFVRVNDTRRFAEGANPYLAAGGDLADAQPGSYWIEYDKFLELFHWENSLLATVGADVGQAPVVVVPPTTPPQPVPTPPAPTHGARCCFHSPAGQSACSVGGSPMPLGATCTCTWGSFKQAFVGSVCQ